LGLAWKFASVARAEGSRVLVNGDRMPGGAGIPKARLNFAENLLRRRRRVHGDGFWGKTR